MADLTEMFYKQWEKMFSMSMQQLVQNKSFLSHMGRLMEGSNLFKMTVDKAILKALESMHLLTRPDLEETAATVQRLETALARANLRLEQLEQKLDAVAGGVAVLASAATAPEPAKKAPAKKK